MSITELERDLDRQWNDAQLRADKALDEWAKKVPHRRTVMLYATTEGGFVCMLDEMGQAGLNRTFRGADGPDARAQAAQVLISEGYAAT